MGHKYALLHELKPTLATLVDEAYIKYNRAFAALSAEEERNWKAWHNQMSRKVQEIPEPERTGLTRTILRGIRHLKNMNVICKQADKNLGLVPIRRDIYNALRAKHLNSDSFKKANFFPHQDILRRMKNIFKLKGMPEQGMDKILEHAKEAKEPAPFYVVPKLHKPTLGTRPITANHSYMLAPLSKALAKVLQIYVDQIPEIPQDSKTVMVDLNELVIREPCKFLTYDVTNCYPSIDLKDAIKILNENIPILQMNANFWTKVLELIMYNNYVVAGEDIYRQMRGTATGTQVAPPFANLYLYYKFRTILASPRILYKSRYVDDGLLILKSDTNCKTLISQLQASSGYKLTYDESETQAIFLDIEIYKGTKYWNERKVDTKVYFKPTNKFLYLPSVSNHPRAHKCSVILGEAVRTLRISSDKTHWLKAMTCIFKGLRARGYPAWVIQNQWRKIRWQDRDKFLHTSKQRQKPEGQLVMSRYHPHLKTHWKKLLANHPIRSCLKIRRLGRLTKKQERLLERWPPVIVFKDFHKIANCIISAKEKPPDAQTTNTGSHMNA